MSGRVTSVFVGVILGWIAYMFMGLIMPLPLAILVGIAFGTASMTMFRHTQAVKGFIALMGPVGVVLPLLALRHIAGQFGVEIQAFSMTELVLFLLAYGVFLTTSIGFYRWMPTGWVMPPCR